MIMYRGFIVWGISIIFIMGSFLFFVENGWPGEPDLCTSTKPNTCFCEEFELSDIEQNLPGVRQPINTWSNLYALFTSFIVAFFVYLDRKKYRNTNFQNSIRSKNLIPDLYIFAVLFLGLGSIWFHGSLTKWGHWIDGLSMYLFVSFILFYTVHRVWKSHWIFWIGFLGSTALFSSLHFFLSSLINIITLVSAYLIVEFYIWIRSGVVLQGKKETKRTWCLAILMISIATFFWAASQTGNFLCIPSSVYQGHGLVWHPLAGVMAVLLYFFWRSEDKPI